MNQDKLTVLVVEPQKKPYVKEIDPGLASLQKEVDGYIQSIYPFADPVAIICDEEAKLKGSPLNRALRDDRGHIYDLIAGTFLVVGLGEENFTSLSEDQVKKYSELYRTPELFCRINGRMMVMPMRDDRPKRTKGREER